MLKLGVLWKIRKSRCLGYSTIQAQEADMRPRAPLGGSVVCLGNSNWAFGVLFGPRSHPKGPNNRVDALCTHVFPAGDLRPVWSLPGPNKTPNAKFELPRHKTEPVRGACGFISASWDSMRKYPKHRNFRFFTRSPTSTLNLKPFKIEWKFIIVE